MTDPTPSELATQLGDSIRDGFRRCADPVAAYRMVDSLAPAAESVVTLVADLRARAAADLRVEGWSLSQIAEELGVSRARAQQLVARGRDVAS
jgi:DNA-directed RNA polymerase specialized sigma24 family protein